MVFPHFSVLENLVAGGYAIKNSGQYKANLAKVLDLFPVLKERLQQKAGTLSGGEQQMMAIGRGLMSNPRLLLLDEPSLGLAPVVAEKIFETIREIHDQGGTVLLVEQNVYAALELADRAYILENGVVAMAGAPGELLHNPDVKAKYLGG